MNTIDECQLERIAAGTKKETIKPYASKEFGASLLDKAGLNSSGAFSDIDRGIYVLPVESASISVPSNWSASVMVRDCIDGAVVADKLASFTGVNRTLSTKIAANVIGCVSYTLGRGGARLLER